MQFAQFFLSMLIVRLLIIFPDQSRGLIANCQTSIHTLYDGLNAILFENDWPFVAVEN